MRTIARRLAFLVILVALAWSALWALAARMVSRRTDAFIAAEATHGRNWRCPGRSVSGYPFALVIDCVGPSYDGQAMGRQVQATVAAATASVSLRNPRRLVLTLQPPFALADATTNVTGHWRTLRVELADLPNLREGALHGSDVAVGGTFNGTAASGQTGTLEAHGTLPAGDLAFELGLGAAILPAVDTLLGAAAPLDASVAGLLRLAEVSDAPTSEVQTPEQAMERWRRAGGQVDVTRATVNRAGASVSATGSLHLDERHRIAGKLDAEFVGLAPILARYGISGDVAAVGSLVSSLFGGRHHASTPGALALPIILANGRVGIGPIGTGVALTPLY